MDKEKWINVGALGEMKCSWTCQCQQGMSHTKLNVPEEEVEKEQVRSLSCHFSRSLCTVAPAFCHVHPSVINVPVLGCVDSTETAGKR